jgi:hypothetical protein
MYYKSKDLKMVYYIKICCSKTLIYVNKLIIVVKCDKMYYIYSCT